MAEYAAENDALGAFIRFADAVQAAHERAHRPAYAERCTCGGSVEVGRDVSRADLRRIHANFLGRHRDCVRSPAKGFGLLLPASDENDLTPITDGLCLETECVIPPRTTERSQP